MGTDDNDRFQGVAVDSTSYRTTLGSAMATVVMAMDWYNLPPLFVGMTMMELAALRGR